IQNDEPSTSVTMPSAPATLALALVVHGWGIATTVAAPQLLPFPCALLRETGVLVALPCP
ncbi:MAG: hypothetical protein QOG50_3064, partial [Actinomycetota bacterium]|nr:hypothetical protein [Actinomycetota bacterium]